MTTVAVNLRIVDAINNKTLFEDAVSDVGAGNVQPKSGTPRLCDGTNGNENPFPGPACTNALHKATTNWEGTYYSNLEDFLITGILDVAAGDNTFWSLWVNFKYAQVGGCQMQIRQNDSVLWALIPSTFDPQGVPLSIPLKLKGPRSATKDTDFTVTVINGSDRSAVRYARVMAYDEQKQLQADISTNSYGAATLNLPNTGGASITYTLRATRDGDITSNVLMVVVPDT